MTKKQLFGRAIEPLVWLAFSKTYGVSIGKYTEKQKEFLTGVVDNVYDVLQGKLSCDDLKEIIGDKDGNNVSNSV